MADDLGSDGDQRGETDRVNPELANGDFVSERLDKIKFEEDDGNSVAEIRENLSLNS